MAAMTGEDNRQLVNEAVNKGFLSPAQANVALKAIRHAESTGIALVLREFLVQNKIVSPRRWEEFEKHLMAKAAKDAQNQQPAPAAEITVDLPKAQAELALPFDIAGYRLTEKIGQGGMGSVFKATQKAMRRTVAIKTLSPKYAVDPHYVERFRNEAKAAAALNHPNVIVPIEVGEDKGIHFISMEFIQGESLGQWMDREGRVPWKEATDIVKQVAKGLEYAHKRGIVHRDIKPDNILLDKGSGLAKIADLGLARRAATADGSLSQEGQAVGTPYYVAPEQARGQKDLDGRADLYSLGATFWHMLAGVPPFEGVTAAVIMTKHLTEPVPDPRSAVADLPENLVSIIYMLMAKDRTERYANATELIEDLEALENAQSLPHGRGLKRSGKERSPLAVPVVRGGAGASRLREPGMSRPAASRLRGPGMSRAAGLSRSGGSHVLTRRPHKSTGSWVVIGICVLLLPIIGAGIYVNNLEKAKQPTVGPSEKSGSKTDAKSEDSKSTVQDAREAAAQKELRDADDFAHAHPLPFNQESVLGRYKRIVNEQSGTNAAQQAKQRVEDLQRAIKALQNAASSSEDPGDSR